VFALALGAMGAFPAIAAELLELVVQVSHPCSPFRWVFLTTWQPKLAGPLTRYGHGALPPDDLTMPGQRQRGLLSVENRSRADQHARTWAVLECGYTSFEVSGTGPQW